MKTDTKKQGGRIWKIVLAAAFTIMFFALSGENAKADDVVEFDGTTFTELYNCFSDGNINNITIKLMNDVTSGNSEQKIVLILIFQSFSD